MESIKKIVIHEAVVTEIIKYIKNNDLKKGDRLPTERNLTKLLNVSRTSVREALKILEANYTIKIKHGSGIYVNSLDSIMFSHYDESNEYKEAIYRLKQLAQARIPIETFCAVEVSKSITREQLEKLYSYEQMENEIFLNQNNNSNGEIFVSLGLELMISELYGNAFISDFHTRLDGFWKKYFSMINAVPYPSELRHQDHIDIIMAIELKNKDKIEKSVRNHVQRVIESLDKLL